MAAQAEASQEYAQPEDADAIEYRNIERLQASHVVTTGGVAVRLLDDAARQRASNENRPSRNQPAAVRGSADLAHLEQVFIPRGGYCDVK